MTHTEITEAVRLIRPILASQLSLCLAVYAPTDHVAETERIRLALLAFDLLAQAMYAQPAPEQDKQPDGHG